MISRFPLPIWHEANKIKLPSIIFIWKELETLRSLLSQSEQRSSIYFLGKQIKSLKPRPAIKALRLQENVFNLHKQTRVKNNIFILWCFNIILWYLLLFANIELFKSGRRRKAESVRTLRFLFLPDISLKGELGF